MKNLLALFLVLLAVGCKVSKPKGIIDEAVMEEILYEYHLAQAVASGADSTNVKGRAYVLACFRKNGVSEAQFDSSMVWYCQHMEYLQKIYQRIDARYRSELASLGAATNDVNRYSTLSTTGDTANVWNAHSFYLLSGNGFNNRMSFEVEADTSYRAGDSFMLNFRAEFLQREGQRHGIAVMAVQYDNDSVAYVMRHFYGSGDNSLSLPSVSRAPKRVYGYVYMLSEWNASPRLLFLFQPSLVRMHRLPQQNAPASEDAVKPDSTGNDMPNPNSSQRNSRAADVYSKIGNGGAVSVSPEQMHSRPMPRKMSK